MSRPRGPEIPKFSTILRSRLTSRTGRLRWDSIRIPRGRRRLAPAKPTVTRVSRPRGLEILKFSTIFRRRLDRRAGGSTVDRAGGSTVDRAAVARDEESTYESNSPGGGSCDTSRIPYGKAITRQPTTAPRSPRHLTRVRPRHQIARFDGGNRRPGGNRRCVYGRNRRSASNEPLRLYLTSMGT